jgi:hypothetical protein
VLEDPKNNVTNEYVLSQPNNFHLEKKFQIPFLHLSPQADFNGVSNTWAQNIDYQNHVPRTKI